MQAAVAASSSSSVDAQVVAALRGVPGVLEIRRVGCALDHGCACTGAFVVRVARYLAHAPLVDAAMLGLAALLPGLLHWTVCWPAASGDDTGERLVPRAYLDAL